MEKYIHIHAKATEIEYEVFEQVKESVAVRRLTTIRDNFMSLHRRFHHAGKLIVKTRVVNPELPFGIY